MTYTDLLLLWSSRLFGIAVGFFLALFALDAVRPGASLGAVVRDVAIHLVPASVVLLIVALSWRWRWIGAAGFFVLAIAYALMVRSRLDWTLAISGPLLVASGLFFWSWLRRPG